ncbi:Conserved_hypothetical protein [Hexamita inflata]|uniref:Myb-like domain-containing protein n=1 Tax=Hexamita inflata TaxID=28002 RepID=A0ABP1GUK8_9EUKA
MQTTHTKTFTPKKKWSDEEVKIFFTLLPKYGSDFKQYVQHMDRTYSQIKSFYHNYLKRHGSLNEIDSPEQSFRARDYQVQNLQRSQFSQETAQMLDTLMDIILNRYK